MLSRNWKKHSEAVFKVQSNALEDFAVEKIGSSYRATYTAGPNLQNQRAFHAFANSPFGPFEKEESAINTQTMTRLYRSRIDDKRRVITQVWPGLPKAGLWLHTDISPLLTVRELLVAPQKPFDIVAGNPAIFNNPDGDVDIAWEGRAKKVFWKLYTGALHLDGSVSINLEPLLDGANPSYFYEDGIVYLYYSVWKGNGFQTWVMFQSING